MISDVRGVLDRESCTEKTLLSQNDGSPFIPQCFLHLFISSFSSSVSYYLLFAHVRSLLNYVQMIFGGAEFWLSRQSDCGFKAARLFQISPVVEVVTQGAYTLLVSCQVH